MEFGVDRQLSTISKGNNIIALYTEAVIDRLLNKSRPQK